MMEISNMSALGYIGATRHVPVSVYTPKYTDTEDTETDFTGYTDILTLSPQRALRHCQIGLNRCI